MSTAVLVKMMADEVRSLLEEERATQSATVLAAQQRIDALVVRVAELEAREPTRGEPGPKGEKGDPGEPIKGDPGERGEKGVDGKDGRDGRDGKDGIASRDELLAEVAKAVEAERSRVDEYIEKAIAALPTLQYRGVYQPDEEYAAGSVVTWAGSTWHASAATKDRPGEGQTDWQLMVKRGRDGKDRT